MRKHYLKILKKIPVYANHEANAKIIRNLFPNQLIPFNREKRRNGTNWMEIYLNDNEIGYIKKKSNTFYQCEYVSLDDESAIGVSFISKTGTSLPMDRLFFPEGYLSLSRNNISKVKLESIKNAAENKMIGITLEYPKELIEVKTILFKKGEKFYITNKTEGKNDIFLEVNDLKNKQGFLLKKTNYSNLEDKIIINLSIAIVALIALGIFLAFLANGWIVVSGLMIVVGLVAAFVFIFVLQILILILKGIFGQIRKRF